MTGDLLARIEALEARVAASADAEWEALVAARERFVAALRAGEEAS